MAWRLPTRSSAAWNSDWLRSKRSLCVKLYRPFSDVFLERTYVHHPEGLELIAVRNARSTEAKRGGVACPVDTSSESERTRRLPSTGLEKLDGGPDISKSRAADAAFLATESQPRGWTAGTHG